MEKRNINISAVKESVKKLCLKANTELRADVLKSMKNMYADECAGTSSEEMMKVLVDNAKIASDKKIPICQDTGMVVCFLEIGDQVVFDGGNITSAVNLVIAQRLVRRLHICKKRDDLPREALIQAGFDQGELDDVKIYRPIGCAECNGGYRGRSGIFQVMPITDSIGRIILEEGDALNIAEQARKEGIADLRESARYKVSKGITDLIEINRVTKD